MTLDEQINLIYVKIADAIDDWFNDRTIDPRQIAIDEIKALIADEVKKARLDENRLSQQLNFKRYRRHHSDPYRADYASTKYIAESKGIMLKTYSLNRHLVNRQAELEAELQSTQPSNESKE